VFDELASILKSLSAQFRKTAILVSVDLIKKQGGISVPRQVPLDTCVLGLIK
jgi:hypothetical protein